MMYLAEDQIENGFWYHRPEKSFHPKATTYPDEYDGSSKLNIVCTQLTISEYQQRKLVNQWCQLLPEMNQIRYLWFSSRVNQAMLDAVCDNHFIEGLYIKWGGIKDLTKLKNMKSLKFFHLGTSPSVESIEVFLEMGQLIVLELENIKKIRDLSPLHILNKLEGLAITGSMWTTQIVNSLEPLSTLENLRYIFLFNLNVLDRTLAPLAKIKTSQSIKTYYWWPKSEFQLLRDSLPELKYGSPFETELIDQFGM